MPITALPALDRTTAGFKANVDTFFGTQLPLFSVEAEAARVEVNAKQAQALASADTAYAAMLAADASRLAAAGSATTALSERNLAVAARIAAEAALDSFDDRYLGPKAVAPTLDNDGAALLPGALYWDTGISAMRGYTGAIWVTLPAAVAGAVGNTALGLITETNVQGAINGLETRKAHRMINLAPGADLDAILVSGFYRVLGTPINGPAGFADYGLIVAEASDITSQIAFTRLPHRMWTRGRLGAAWTAWVEMADTSTVQALTNKTTVNGVPLLHLNDITNGDFRIAQAGTSFPAAANGAYDLDGWLSGYVSATAFTVAQVAGSSAGRFARQVTITTADAVVAISDFVIDRTIIEGFDIEKYVGQTFTVAFRARVPVAGIHCVAMRNSGADRSYVAEINFPTANVFQNCSFTVTGGLPTAGVWNYTNGIGLVISFTHMAGTDLQTTPNAWQVGNFLGTANQVNDCATVGNVWALEKVTLNLGTVAAVSESDIGDDLRKCQRYFEIKLGTAQVLGASSARAFLSKGADFAVTKRATPSLVITSLATPTAGAVSDYSGGNVLTISAMPTASVDGIDGFIQTTVSMTAGSCVLFRYTASSRL